MTNARAKASNNVERQGRDAQEFLASLEYKPTDYLLAGSVAEYMEKRRRAIVTGGRLNARV